MLKILYSLFLASFFWINTAYTGDFMLFDRVGFDDEEYIDLLAKMIAHTAKLQNNPSNGLIPQEKLIADEIIKFYGENHPSISVTIHAYDQEGKRPNLIIRYKHPDALTDNKTISFMGSHMDVVPANPDEWQRNPFQLSIEQIAKDLKLHGRGTTDCLGHVALISVLFKRLAEQNVKLSHELVAVFIADEEVGDANVGVFRLHQDRLLDDFKNGPIYWVDTATDDGLFGPRVGTAGIGKWSIKVVGRAGHSGYPQHCINPISASVDLINYINQRFEKDFQNEKALTYARAHLYPTGSTCKCTSIRAEGPSKNVIPEECIFGGDVRFTPDFDIETIKQSLPKYIAEFNANMNSVKQSSSRADGGRFHTFNEQGEKQDLSIEFQWDNEDFYQPFAADMESDAYKNIVLAMKDVRDRVQPFSALGSLPLLFELQQEGYSLVPIGFGRQKAYHAPNEYCVLSEMRDGYKVLLRVIELFERQRVQ